MSWSQFVGASAQKAGPARGSDQMPLRQHNASRTLLDSGHRRDAFRARQLEQAEGLLTHRRLHSVFTQATSSITVVYDAEGFHIGLFYFPSPTFSQLLGAAGVTCLGDVMGVDPPLIRMSIVFSISKKSGFMLPCWPAHHHGFGKSR